MNIQDLLKKLFPGKEDAWMSLLTATGIVNLHDFSAEGTPIELIDNLNACMQKLWLRPPGKERWDVIDDHLTESQQKTIFNALQVIGLYDPVEPTQSHYDAVILMDGWEHSACLRIDYLVKYWNKGVRFKRLYVMVIDRPLDKVHEPIWRTLESLGLATNETEMMKYLVNKAMKQPGVFEGVDIVYVHAHGQRTATRATTSDNFISWEQHHGVGRPEYYHDHKILIVTNQPYVAYQGAVAAQHLSKNFTTMAHTVSGKETHFIIFGKYELESIGDKWELSQFAVGLDTLARYVYSSRERWHQLFA
ncbi:MAG: hypothetical protein ACHQAX_07885 [Gammaproteobacteria bacterium]